MSTEAGGKYGVKMVLFNISGYVVKGGITASKHHLPLLFVLISQCCAVMGASASGKSVLMKVLAGRLPLLQVNGEITLDGRPMNLMSISNDVAFVPQDDFLMGELTPTETLLNALTMKRATSKQKALREVDSLLRKFGLDHVANNAIGTVFKRGLSGGQRKRVEVCSELVAPPAVLLLDEPTSGLDGAIAYEVLSAIKGILAERCGELSLVIAIHQPNSRILELFDHILLLGGGGMIFFGTLPQAKSHFSELGFPAPEAYTPTDVFLQVSDRNFGENHAFDFEGSFACSKLAVDLHRLLDDVRRAGMSRALQVEARSRKRQSKNSQVDVEEAVVSADQYDSLPTDETDDAMLSTLAMGWRQYRTLLYRDFTLAYRDPSLYYLQFLLVSMFGFLVGAAFFNLKPKIDARIVDIPSGLLWIAMMMIYIQVFKLYHLSKADQRYRHEIANQTYFTLAYFLAELTATSVLLISFIPGTVCAYFMMGLPSSAYPFLLFVYWMVSPFYLQPMLILLVDCFGVRVDAECHHQVLFRPHRVRSHQPGRAGHPDGLRRRHVHLLGGLPDLLALASGDLDLYAGQPRGYHGRDGRCHLLLCAQWQRHLHGHPRKSISMRYTCCGWHL